VTTATNPDRRHLQSTRLNELDPKPEKSRRSSDRKARTGRRRSAFILRTGGLALANGNLYVADTNNHAIRVVDLKTKRASTLAYQRSHAAAKNMQALETALVQTPKRSKSRRKSFARREWALQIDVELPAATISIRSRRSVTKFQSTARVDS
jgi:hypothetical protein